MSFHLEGPWLTTTGKKKGKKKFRTAKQAQRAKQCAKSWQELLDRYAVDSKKKKPPFTPLVPQTTAYRRETPRIESHAFTGEPCLKTPDKVYTGDAMLGIGVMHKSNSVPIFREQDAKDISKMRR